jgi:DNA-directed RNA polymerase subunit L
MGPSVPHNLPGPPQLTLQVAAEVKPVLLVLAAHNKVSEPLSANVTRHNVVAASRLDLYSAFTCF